MGHVGHPTSDDLMWDEVNGYHLARHTMTEPHPPAMSTDLTAHIAPHILPEHRLGWFTSRQVEAEPSKSKFTGDVRGIKQALALTLRTCPIPRLHPHRPDELLSNYHLYWNARFNEVRIYFDITLFLQVYDIGNTPISIFILIFLVDI